MSRDLDALILDAIRHFGDATAGQIAAWIAAPTEPVYGALFDLHHRGRVDILPQSRTWIAVEIPAAFTNALADGHPIDRADGTALDLSETEALAAWRAGVVLVVRS